MSLAPEPGPLKCDHGLRRQTIVQSLLTDVFQGRLRAGQHLVTQELAERFGVSHTPIREALIALAGIGIIDLLPNRGAIVRRDAVGGRTSARSARCAGSWNARRAGSPAAGSTVAELHALAADFERHADRRPRPGPLHRGGPGMDSRLARPDRRLVRQRLPGARKWAG